MAVHPDDDQPYPAPRVEPCVERAECWRLRRELEEAEGGGEEGAAAVLHRACANKPMIVATSCPTKPKTTSMRPHAFFGNDS